MEKTITLEFGPMTVEFHAFEGEEYQSEVLDLLKFVETNEDKFDKVGAMYNGSKNSLAKNESSSSDEILEIGDSDGEEPEPGPLSSIASELRVPEAELREIFDINPSGETPPVIYVDQIDEMGKRQKDRQRNVSLLLLYVWHECYDEKRVKSSGLKNALELSDVSASGMANMYQGEGDRFFDRRGRGPTATVALTPPGKRQARKLLKRYVQEEKVE